MKRLVRFVEGVRACSESAWASLVVRAALVGCALLLLAWVGAGAGVRSDPAAPPLPASEAGDAGAGGTAGEAGVAPPPSSAALQAIPPERVVDAEAPRAASRSRASPDDPVHLNRASADDLRRLPGCGDKRAEAILALRGRLGRFTRVEELLRVKGVGRTTLRKWKPLVQVD